MSVSAARGASQLSNVGSLPRDSGGHFFNFPEFVGKRLPSRRRSRRFGRLHQLGSSDERRRFRERIEGVLARFSPLFFKKEELPSTVGEIGGRVRSCVDFELCGRTG